MKNTRGGTGFLVGFRQRLLQSVDTQPSWVPVEADLRHVLRGVFNRDVLDFRRLDLETPASLLEKLTEYEAVHEIRGADDLRRRLEADRRCYAFFHPDWPDEPLIFAEVALTRGLSAKVQRLLNPASPVLDAQSCTCGIFYSITSCQPGLRGFAFGNALIGRVVQQLRAELPRLRTFATLSPIPGFRSWLSDLAQSGEEGPAIAPLIAKLEVAGWFEDRRLSAELEAALMPLCAHYLLHAKQGDEPLDPVERFHLGNGARLHRINWLSDVSAVGLYRSAGITANYLYHPTKLERNLQAYSTGHRVIASRQLEQLSRRVAIGLGREEWAAAVDIPA